MTHNNNTSNKEVDLNINNYELEDILQLFKIPKNFEERHLKIAKQVVLKTHPDKSRLPAKFFLFYSQAYKILFNVYEFRNKSTKNMQTDTSYVEIISGDSEKEIALAEFFKKNEKLKETKNFNKWFNEEFDKNKLENEDNIGYGDWLSSNEDLEPEKKISLSQMAEEMEKKKSKARSLIPIQEVREVYSTQTIQGTSLISSDGPSEFSSDLFSSLPYQDLRQAHVNSVIPVTNEDYSRVQKFQNINEYTSHRNSQDTKPLSELQALEYLKHRESFENSQATKRAYDLAKQTELAEKKNQEFWGKILNIHDK